jgi:hypothetical protein
MSEFAPTVEDSDFYLVASIEKAGDFLHLDPEVVFTYLQPKSHLLQLCRLSAALVLLQLLRALVVVLPPIDYFDDGRVGVG